MLFLGPVLIFLAVFFMNGTAFSQITRVTLEGLIMDDEGVPLPGVTVIARNMETGYVLSCMTREDGSYIISGIDPGKYECEVRLAGFATQIRRGMTFEVGAKLKVDFTLSPSTIEEQVTVVAESPMIEVTKSEISSVVDRQMIEDLPLPAEKIMVLAESTPKRERMITRDTTTKLSGVGCFIRPTRP